MICLFTYISISLYTYIQMHTYSNSVLKSNAETIDHCVSTQSLVEHPPPTCRQYNGIQSTVLSYNTIAVLSYNGKAI